MRTSVSPQNASRCTHHKIRHDVLLQNSSGCTHLKIRHDARSVVSPSLLRTRLPAVSSISIRGRWDNAVSNFAFVNTSATNFPKHLLAIRVSTAGPVRNSQLALHSQRRWSHHREFIHRGMKERHADVPESTHLSSVRILARGQRKQHPQHFQWWRALMDLITCDNIVLLHDNTTSDSGLVAITRLDVVTPP